MTPEAAFCKAWGRPPTAHERERLRRLQDAFSIEENDALLTIAMVLEFYDGAFRLYPGKCADATRDSISHWLRSVEGGRVLREALQRAEAGRASCGVATPGGIVRTPGPVAQEFIEARDRHELYWVTLGGLATAASALAGALGMRVGASLSGQQPCWVPKGAGSSVIFNVLGAPTGWVMLIALVVPSLYAGAWGWERARAVGRVWHERWLGWSTLAAVVCWLVAWALMLGKLAGAS